MAGLQDDRLIALAEVRVFLPNGADPYLTKRVYAFYETMAEVFAQDSAPVDTYANGHPLLEFIEGVGLVCTGRLNLQDTITTNFPSSAGTWSHYYPASGGTPRKRRLRQTSTVAGLQWSTGASNYTLPVNPCVIFSLNVPETPPDWDESTYPPYVRIVLGGGAYALEWSKVYGNALLINAGGAWEAIAEIPPLETANNTDNREVFVWFRVHRGLILVGVSARGRPQTYTAARLPHDAYGVPADFPGGYWLCQGQGGQIAGLGIHQMAFTAGDYLSPIRPLDRNRSFQTATFAGSRFSEPTGTSVTLYDWTNHTALLAGYKAILTPATTGTGTPFLFHHSPELYAVRFKYPAVRSIPTGVYTTPFEQTAVRIQEPDDLADSSAEITARLDPSVQASFNYPLTFFEILLKELDSDGTTERSYTVFGGHLTEEPIENGTFNELTWQGKLQNQALRFKSAFWQPFESVPLGGQSVNAAIEEVFESEGLDPAGYITLHVAGNLMPIPAGWPEDPAEWPSEGESKWETLRRIAGYAGLEIIPKRDGTYECVALGYVAAAVTKEWEAAPATDLLAFVQRFRNTRLHLERATYIIVEGMNWAGVPMWFIAIDTDAEEQPTSPRFTPWRITLRDRIPGRTTPGLLIGRAQALAAELFRNRDEAEVVAPIDFTVERRHRGTVTGLNAASPDAAEYSVRAIEINLVSQHFTPDNTITAGLRREA